MTPAQGLFGAMIDKLVAGVAGLVPAHLS